MVGSSNKGQREVSPDHGRSSVQAKSLYSRCPRPGKTGSLAAHASRLHIWTGTQSALGIVYIWSLSPLAAEITNTSFQYDPIKTGRERGDTMSTRKTHSCPRLSATFSSRAILSKPIRP